MRLRAPSFVPVRTALICCAVAMMTLAARPTGQGSSNYTVYTAEGRRNVSSKADAGIDFLPLEPLTSLLKLTIAEDPARGGLLIQGGGESILVIPNQSFVSLGQGRVVSLPGPVRRDGRTWLVPAEFVRLVLAPALGLRAEIRRPSRVILIGDLRMPQISGRVERSGINARLVVDVTPATPFRVTRNGNRLTVQFDAVAFEAASIGGTVPDLITGTRIQGTAILLTLGKSAMGYRVDETDRAHLVIEVAAPPPPPPPPPPPVPTPAPTAVPPGTQAPAPAAQAPPTIDVAPAGTLRTIVIDPGHGGEDAGVHGPGGALEKTVTLQLAKRLKTALESRLSLRTVLTRDDDRTVSADDRARIANTGKGDLFLSLHANASSQPTAAGIQVLSLAPESYVSAAAKSEAPDVPVPVLGGGTRTITLAPSRAAQVPFVAQSTAFAEILARRLASLAGPAGTRPARQLPLRPLAGVHMPAVLIEAGFLSNPADEKALTTGDRAQKLIDALVGTIDDLRRGIPDQAPPAPATPVKP